MPGNRSDWTLGGKVEYVDLLGRAKTTHTLGACDPRIWAEGLEGCSFFIVESLLGQESNLCRH
jgi:hypothetical protein